MIKILYLIDKLIPAGTQTNLLEVVRRIDRTRFEPKVIALLGGGELVDEFKEFGVFPIELSVKRAYGISGIRALFFLIRFMKREKIDIVQNHFLHADILGTIAAKLAGIRTIVTTRRDEGFWQGKRQLMLNRYFNQFADVILANSLAVKEAVVRNEEVSSHRIHVIHNGVDTKKFYPSTELREINRRRLGIQENEVVIGMIANMRHEIKGHRILIKALSLLPAT